MATDAALGDFEHTGSHATDRYPITVVRGPHGARTQVAPCGNWNQDLTETKDNRPYENLGCAVQTNIAAEIVNPDTIDIPTASSPKNATTAVDAVKRQELAVSQPAASKTTGP